MYIFSIGYYHSSLFCDPLLVLENETSTIDSSIKQSTGKLGDSQTNTHANCNTRTLKSKAIRLHPNITILYPLYSKTVTWVKCQCEDLEIFMLKIINELYKVIRKHISSLQNLEEKVSKIN